MSRRKIDENIHERSKEIMDAIKEGKKKKNKVGLKPRTLSLEEKNEIGNKEENELEKQIQDLKTWTDEIEAMNDEQLIEYLKNRPLELKTLKIQTSKPKEKVQKVCKSKPPKYTGVLASVMKFHKEDNEESSAKPDA